MNFIKFLLVFFLTLMTFSSNAIYKNSFRKCMLLPIQDSIGGAIGFGVFQNVEQYLKSSDWCVYQHNSEILNILSHYKHNLESHLENPEVIKLLSQKTRSGSVIRVKLNRRPDGKVDIRMSVLAENGDDILYQNKTISDNDQIEILAQEIKNWLEAYKAIIPYDGRVTGVLGNQFTIDIGKVFGVYPNAKLVILRPTQRKKHPLLKEIVNFETIKIADAVVYHLNDSQSQGNVKVFVGKRQIQIGDWVLIDKNDKKFSKIENRFVDPKNFTFGSLGKVGVNLLLASSSASYTFGTTRKIGGLNYGVGINSELWVTRNYFVGLDLHKLFGSYSEKEGTVSADSNSPEPTKLKMKFGYRYLPLGFFYGPQVDAYFGYKKLSYSFDQVDGFLSHTYSGFIVGIKGDMPLHKKVRMFLSLDFMINAEYEEDASAYGEEDSASNYEIEIGANYMYGPRINFDVAFDINSSRSKFRAPTRTLSSKETSLRMGVNFIY